MHSRQQRALHREVEQAFLAEEVEDEPGIFQVVVDQRPGILAVEALDGLPLSGPVFVDPFAAPEDVLCGGFEPIVLEADGVAHERDAVEHHASRNVGAAIACETCVLAESDRARNAAEFAVDAQCVAARDEDAQVEVDHVPAGQDIGVECTDALDEALEQCSLLWVRAHGPSLGSGGSEQVGFFRSIAGDQRCTGDGACVQRRLEIEGHDLQVDSDLVGGAQIGVVEEAEAAVSPGRFAVDRDARPYAPIGEEAVGKADVRLTRRDPTCNQTVPHWRDARRNGQGDSAQRLAREIAEGAGFAAGVGFVAQ